MTSTCTCTCTYVYNTPTLLFVEFAKCCKDNEHTNKWKLVGVANSSQLGTHDRIRGKVEKIKQLAREAARITESQEVSTDDGAEMQNLRDAFQERERELLQQVEELQQEIHRLKKKAEVRPYKAMACMMQVSSDILTESEPSFCVEPNAVQPYDVHCVSMTYTYM